MTDRPEEIGEDIWRAFQEQGKRLNEAQEKIATLAKERDFLLGKDLLSSNALAAAQAREAKLREALHNCYGLTGPLDIPMIEVALALPTDDSALQKRLAQERERCAQHLVNEANGAVISGSSAAAIIRSMK